MGEDSRVQIRQAGRAGNWRGPARARDKHVHVRLGVAGAGEVGR